MVNHQKIIQDLEDRRFTQDEIAKRNDCSLVTVGRIARKNGLQIGRGNRPASLWGFSESSPELAYLVGAFITDGWIKKDYRSKKPKQVSISSTTPEFIDAIEQCALGIGLYPKRYSIRPDARRKGNLEQRGLTICNTMFALWIYEAYKDKSQIPDFILSLSVSHKIAFIAGALDGDGSIAKTGEIRIRGVDHWLFQLPDLLRDMEIRCSNCRVERVLDSGKPYYAVQINRKDYLQQGGFCIIQQKQSHLQNPEKRNKKYHYTRRRYICPICGLMIMSRKDAISCNACFRKSDRFIEHCRRIAPIGGKRGNEARWGKKH